MLESAQRRSSASTLDSPSRTIASTSNKISSPSFASRFSAALSNTADIKTPGSVRTGTSSTLGRGRSISVASRPQDMLASAGTAHRNSEPGGRNLLEIPMDQPVSVTKSQTASVPAAIPAAAPRPAYSPSRDTRDGVSDQTGKVTSGGAPSVVRLATPIANQWGYTGEAAYNPYFVTSGNPMRDGMVTGYPQWFETNHIGGLSDAEMNVNYSATDDGANEALRLVQKYDPGATLGSSRFGAVGVGPWLADKDTREVVLSNGAHVNAGLLLGSYYNHGQGVTAMSDQLLQLQVKA